MRRLVLRYGLGAGAVFAVMFAVTIPLLYKSGSAGFDRGELVGYSSMVLAFLLVFFGIRSYREEVGDGVVSFGKAFQVGILITLVACAVYVVAWEIVYWGFYPDFLDQYTAHAIDKMRRSGESAAAIAEMEADMAGWAKLYANPLINAGITFLEVFPVGLVITLVSAAILRRRDAPEPAAA